MFKKLYIFLKKNINKIFSRDIKFLGNYNSWNEAKKKSIGYNSKIIFQKTKESFLKVRNNEATYERDSFLFYKKKINYELINALFYIKGKKKKINILDFGGSFGSTYFQNKTILNDIHKFDWSIIEQKRIVNFIKNFQLEGNLHFYSSLNGYFKKKNPDLVLMSSVLQYLENPFKVLNYLLKKKVNYFLLLRTLVHNKNEEIKVQVVPKHIYKSSYPVRIFNQSLLLNYFFKNDYRLIKNSFKNEPIGGLVQKNFFFKLKSF